MQLEQVLYRPVHDPSNEHVVPAAALLPVLVGQVGGSFSKAAEGSLIQSGDFMVRYAIFCKPACGH